MTSPVAPEPTPRERPTLWIALTALLAVAAVGLAIWAVSAQSSADDAEAALAAQSAAATPDVTPTAMAQPVAEAPELDPQTQQRFEDVQAQLGDVGDDVAGLRQEIDQARREPTTHRPRSMRPGGLWTGPGPRSRP